ncbi:MAG: FAD-binding oxidoreductase [Thermomicrobiales bacterium]
MQQPEPDVIVNDVHSRLNETRVARILRPTSTDEIVMYVRDAAQPLAIAGGRHAMGGQQFASDDLLLDMTGLNHVLAFDPARGEIEAEAGMMWPALAHWLAEAQPDRPGAWGIIQKQTGADDLTIGGAVSANVHGRVLGHGPIVADVIGLTVIDAEGIARCCSRTENAELFRLAIGGYGLFGPLTSIRLRLRRRSKVRRTVRPCAIDAAVPALEAAAAGGLGYGDFQFAIDPGGDDFLRMGICSTYGPVSADTPILADQRALSREDWETLFWLAHTDPRRASDAYTGHYLATDGQLYWSDRHQFADYHPGYHAALDRRLHAAVAGSEMITELYVPRPALPAFMADVAADLRQHGDQVIYGTVRLIERDRETFLAWAREPWACVVINLHVDHSPDGIHRATKAFRRLIARALSYRGSFYLTYHRWATREQVRAAYPQFVSFLREKHRYDPMERFQSDWYRHYRGMFGEDGNRATSPRSNP